MIKKTLFFSNPCYLSSKNNQLVIQSVEQNEKPVTRPIEDLGMLVLEHPQITISHYLLAQLVDNNCAVITCDQSHLPNGLFMPLAGNSLQTVKFKNQINASKPLLKNLWQQTIMAKITNQANLLESLGENVENMRYWSSCVTSGDSKNHEARAAAFYWSMFFGHLKAYLDATEKNFTDDFINRHRYGQPPNNLLNYGYAILRACVARGLVSSGLLPTLGIHHKNKYNAYCLADDIMEPYRPYVDLKVMEIVLAYRKVDELTPEIKKQLLTIPTKEIIINGERSPLMVGLQRTTASLAKCYDGDLRKIAYPNLTITKPDLPF